MLDKTNLLFITTVFVFSLIIGIFIYNFIKNNKQNPMAKSNIQNQEVVHYIALKENKANPDALSIKLGEIVQFNSKDEGYHNITQGEGNDFEKNHGHYEDSIDSGKFGPDEAYRVQIKKIGVYHFHDHLNPDIYATVIVTN